MDTTDNAGQNKKPAKKKSKRKNLWHTNYRSKYKQKMAKELPEEKIQRLLYHREHMKRRLQNETLAEREERLRMSRWKSAQQRIHESFETREKRIEERRLQTAMKRSRKKQEQARVDSLLLTGQTYETTIWKSIRDQLHRANEKVIRLSATNITHVHIDPSSTKESVNTSRSIAEKLVAMPLYSCPIQDGLNSDEAAFYEPKCVLNEQDNPENSGLSVSTMKVLLKTEPISSDEEADFITGDLDIPLDVEPRTELLNKTHQPASIVSEKIKSELVTPPNLELKTNLVENVKELPILKSEVIIKTDVDTVNYVHEL